MHTIEAENRSAFGISEIPYEMIQNRKMIHEFSE